MRKVFIPREVVRVVEPFAWSFTDEGNEFSVPLTPQKVVNTLVFMTRDY